MCSVLADACQIHLQTLGLMSAAGFVVSKCAQAWHSLLPLVPVVQLPSKERTNGLIYSNSKIAQICVTSQSGCISSPCLVKETSVRYRKPSSSIEVYTHSVRQTPRIWNSAQSFEKCHLCRQSTILSEKKKSWIFNRRKNHPFIQDRYALSYLLFLFLPPPPTFAICNLRTSLMILQILFFFFF